MQIAFYHVIDALLRRFVTAEVLQEEYKSGTGAKQEDKEDKFVACNVTPFPLNVLISCITINFHLKKYFMLKTYLQRKWTSSCLCSMKRFLKANPYLREMFQVLSKNLKTN